MCKNLKYIILISFFVFGNLYFAFCQNEIDSLYQKIQTEAKDTVYLDKLLELIIDIQYTYIDRAEVFSQEVLEVAEKTDNQRYIAKAYIAYGFLKYIKADYENAEEYHKKAEKICININNNDLLAIVYNDFGMISEAQGNYDGAIEFYFKALKINEKVGNKLQTAMNLNNIGGVYDMLEDYEKALKYFNQSLEIKKELNKPLSLAYAYINVSLIYQITDSIDLSFKYLTLAEKICDSLNDYYSLGYVYSQYSGIYELKNDTSTAIKYLEKSLEVREKVGDIENITLTLGELGRIYFEQNKLAKALYYSDRGLSLALENNLVFAEMEILKNLSAIYSAKGNYEKAYNARLEYELIKDSIFNIEKQQKISTFESEAKQAKIDLLTSESEQQKLVIERNRLQKISLFIILLFIVALILFFLFYLLNYRKKNELLKLKNQEIENQKEEIVIQNEILFQQKEELIGQAESLQVLNTDLINSKKVIEQINSDLKELSVIAAKTDNAIMVIEKDGNILWVNNGFTKIYGFTLEEFKQRSSNIFISSTNSFVIEPIKEAIANKNTIIYDTKLTTKANKEIWVQTTWTPVLNENNEVIKMIAIDSDISKLKIAEEKISMQNIEIKSSIQYASKIQSSILPKNSAFENRFSEFFILFKPKDIVSGDFYWLHNINNLTYIAVADCTGHGVPGAMLSMMANTFLYEIVIQNSDLMANTILNKLREKIIGFLNNSDEKTQVREGLDISLCIFDEQLRKVQFSGAYHSILHFSNNDLIEYKSDKMPIGVYFGKIFSEFQLFEIKYVKDDIFYFYSDGFSDQIGFEENKKFLRKNFYESIKSVTHLPLKQQNIELENILENWRNQNYQTDDITVIGVKLK